MGQLEKYGLYVLCLVIFLILGVTIWGGGDVPPGKSPAVSMHAPSGAGAGAKTNNAAGGPHLPALAELLDASTEPGRGAAVPATGKGDAGNTNGGGGGGAKELAKSDPRPEPKAEPRVDAKPVTYRVQEGDTFDSIARTKLGKSSLRDELMRLNPTIEPRTLRPGMDLQLPSAAAIAATDAKTNAATDAKTKAAIEKPIAPAADGSRTYVLQKGDTFERIAKAELGSAKRTSELLELNSGLDPTKLRVGMTIKLPAK